MDLKQLKYFLTILEEGNITRAAEKLHMSQPPLSQQLKSLEQSLGIELLVRNTRNLHPTKAGEHLRHRGIQILDMMNNTIKELKNLDAGLSGVLSIGFVASSGGIVVPNYMVDFAQTHPDISFQLREGNTYRILDLLNNGVIEIGFVRTPFNTEAYHMILLPNEPMVAVCQKDTFFKSEDRITMASLENLPIIYDLRFESIIVSACHKAGFQPKVICEGEDSRSLLLFASMGIGVSILPQSSLHLMAHDHLCIKEIHETSLHTQTAIVWLKNRLLSTVAEQFLQKYKT